MQSYKLWTREFTEQEVKNIDMTKHESTENGDLLKEGLLVDTGVGIETWGAMVTGNYNIQKLK